MTHDYGVLVSVAVSFEDIPTGGHYDFSGGILFADGRLWIPLKHDDPDDDRYVELSEYIRAITRDELETDS